ncbi:MAG: hypothetical protein AAFY17_07150 [Cyanobacteria bacterium J06642_11]
MAIQPSTGSYGYYATQMEQIRSERGYLCQFHHLHTQTLIDTYSRYRCGACG